ncbi:MAG: ABC transporter ATP-binding protein [Cyanobacteria bacterium P01_C01_bin.89]
MCAVSLDSSSAIAPISDPILDIRDVHAGYVPGLNILQGVNLSVAPGELVAIIGPNGAGKSTLAKAIAGLLTPNQGSITFQGQNIGHLPANEVVRQGICYVPQISNVFRTLTVEENLEMGAFILEVPLKPLKQKIFTMFPRLAERRTQQAGTLSGGERQMLAMGKALMLEPKLLVLDEPSAALSPLLVMGVFEQIRAVVDSGTAVVLVEQNAKRALEMADRGCVMEAGRDRFTGLGRELLNNPKVAELYLGTSAVS